jgi:hypothetical protein
MGVYSVGHWSSFLRADGRNYADITLPQKRTPPEYHREFYIHAEAKNNNHLNNDHTFFPNAIFDVLLKKPQP